MILIDMQEADVHRIRNWFESYTERFQADCPEQSSSRAMMLLKYEHSLRVSREAAQLAADLGWDRGDQRTAEVLGLLHDTGRFSQMAEFGTFRDADSVNHAFRGHQVIQEEGILGSCSGARQAQILEGIRYHNGLRVPADLRSEQLAFIHLIRDADKLDIFQIFLDAFKHNRLNDYPEIVHQVDLDGPASPDLLAEVLAGRVPSYRLIRSLNDWKLLQISWAYDLFHRPTCRRVLERKVLPQLADLLPMNGEIRAALEKARSHLEARCRPE